MGAHSIPRPTAWQRLTKGWSPREVYAMAVAIVGTVLAFPALSDLSVLGTVVVSVLEFILLLGIFLWLPVSGGSARKVLISLLGLVLAVLMPSLLRPIFPAPHEYATTTYSPYGPDGKMKKALKIKARVSGHCWESVTDMGRDEAYRCIDERSHLLDPCFASPGSSRDAGASVVCADDPWSPQVTVLVVTQPLIPNAWGTVEGASPWAIELSTGERCGYITGAQVTNGGQRLNYGCDLVGGGLYDIDLDQGTARLETSDLGINDALIARVWF